MLNSSPRARRWLVTLFAVVLAIFTTVPVLHCIRGQSIKDYIVWYEAGRAVLRGAEVYPELNFKFPFMYPPPCALFLAAAAALGQLGLIIVLVAICAAAWIGSVLLSVQLAVGSLRTAPVLFALPNLVVAVYMWSNFLLGQPSIVLLALMLVAFALLQRGHEISAGVAIAFAVAIKAFPFIAILYLLYRRYWLAAASLVVVTAALFVLLPIPFRGFELSQRELARWSRGMLLKYDESGVAQRAPRSYSWRNQSIWGVANRLLRHVESDPAYGPHKVVYSSPVDLRFSTVNAIILLAAGACGLAFIAVMPRRGQRTPEADALEFALLLLLMLLFTPMSFGYMFVWLLFPFTVITQRLISAPSRMLWICAIAAVALLALTIPWRVTAQTYGNVFAATLLLFAALAAELWRVKRAEVAR